MKKKKNKDSVFREIWDEWGAFIVLLVLGLLLALTSAIEKKIDNWDNTSPTTQTTK